MKAKVKESETAFAALKTKLLKLAKATRKQADAQESRALLKHDIPTLHFYMCMVLTPPPPIPVSQRRKGKGAAGAAGAKKSARATKPIGSGMSNLAQNPTYILTMSSLGDFNKRIQWRKSTNEIDE